MDRQAPLNPGSILDTGNVGQGPAAMEVESGSAGDNGLEPDVQIKQEQVHFTTGRPFEPLEVIVIPDDDEDGDFDMSMIPFMEAAAMEALYRPADGDDELELATNDGQANEPLDQTQAGPARNAQFTGPQATAAQPVPIPVDTERLGRFRDRIAAESKPSATVGGLNFPEGALDHVLVTKKENRGWQPTIKVLLDHVYAWQFPFPEALLASNDPQAVIVVYMRTCQGRDLTIELHIRLMLEVARRLPRSIKLVFAPVCDSQTIDVFCRENDRVVDDLKPEVSLVLSVDDACHNMASGSSLVVFPLLMTHPDGRAGLLLSRNRVGVKDIFAQSVAFQIYDKMKETYPTVRGIKACIDDDDSRTPESIISQVIPILWDPRVFTVPGIQGGVLARPHGPTIIRNIRPQNEFDGLQNSGMIAVPMTEMTRKICFGNFKRPRGDAVDWIYMLNLQMNTKNGTGLVLVVVLMLCHYYSSRMIDNRTKESLNIWNGRLVLGVGEGPKYRTVQATLPPGLTGPHVALAREVLKHGNLLSYCDEVCQRWAAAIIPDGQEQRPWPGSANLFLGLVEEILKMEFEMGASFLFAKGYGCFRRMRNRFGTNKEANEDLLRYDERRRGDTAWIDLQRGILQPELEEELRRIPAVNVGLNQASRHKSVLPPEPVEPRVIEISGSVTAAELLVQVKQLSLDVVASALRRPSGVRIAPSQQLEQELALAKAELQQHGNEALRKIREAKESFDAEKSQFHADALQFGQAVDAFVQEQEARAAELARDRETLREALQRNPNDLMAMALLKTNLVEDLSRIRQLVRIATEDHRRMLKKKNQIYKEADALAEKRHEKSVEKMRKAHDAEVAALNRRIAKLDKQKEMAAENAAQADPEREAELKKTLKDERRRIRELERAKEELTQENETLKIQAESDKQTIENLISRLSGAMNEDAAMM